MKSQVPVQPAYQRGVISTSNAITATLNCGNCRYAWTPTVPKSASKPLVAECPGCHSDNLMPVPAIR